MFMVQTGSVRQWTNISELNLAERHWLTLWSTGKKNRTVLADLYMFKWMNKRPRYKKKKKKKSSCIHYEVIYEYSIFCSIRQ